MILLNEMQDREICWMRRESDAHIGEDDVHQEQDIHDHDVKTAAATDSCHTHLSIVATRSLPKSRLSQIIDYSKLGRLANVTCRMITCSNGYHGANFAGCLLPLRSFLVKPNLRGPKEFVSYTFTVYLPSSTSIYIVSLAYYSDQECNDEFWPSCMLILIING